MTTAIISAVKYFMKSDLQPDRAFRVSVRSDDMGCEA
jgi:hypothetical protein